MQILLGKSELAALARQESKRAHDHFRAKANFNFGHWNNDSEIHDPRPVHEQPQKWVRIVSLPST